MTVNASSYTFSVNRVVAASEVISTAMMVAKQIIENSPDAVQATKRALLLSQKHSFEETVTAHAWSSESKRVFTGENIKVCRHTYTRPIFWFFLSQLKLHNNNSNSITLTGGFEGIFGGANQSSFVYLTAV